jgi:hypothetical protein
MKGDEEPVPASLSRSCPRSFRVASVARYGQDDGVGGRVAGEANPRTSQSSGAQYLMCAEAKPASIVNSLCCDRQSVCAQSLKFSWS